MTGGGGTFSPDCQKSCDPLFSGRDGEWREGRAYCQGARGVGGSGGGWQSGRAVDGVVQARTQRKVTISAGLQRERG